MSEAVSPAGSVAAARGLAHDLLAIELPRRWSHVQQVAAVTELIAAGDPDCASAVPAAWLHDIGYSSRIADTGFHPLDGARHVRANHFGDEIAALVAFHSCARVEAESRDLLDLLTAEFDDDPSPSRDALWAADATTGPDGTRLTHAERLADIKARYGPEDLVTRCSVLIADELASAIERSRMRSPQAFEFYPR